MASKQGGKASSTGPTGRMSMDEYKQLGGLLQKARDERRLGEILVFANVEKETLEQLQRYQQPIVMPKSKAKAGAGSSMAPASSSAVPSMAEVGSMTDASKRRLPDDPEWDDAEVVMDAEDVARLLAEQQVLAYTGEAEVAAPLEGGGYESALPIPHVDTSWFPALNYDDVRTLQGGVPPSVFCPSGSPWSGHMNIWCALPCLEAGR